MSAAWPPGSSGARRMAGGDIGSASRVTLADGGDAFVKTYAGIDAPGLVAAEVAGLRWLGEAADAGAGLLVPDVVAQDAAAGRLALDWVEPAPRGAAAEEALGRGLAALHAAGAPAHGWTPGPDLYLGSLRLPAPETSAGAGWPEVWDGNRLAPLVRAARDASGLDAPGAQALEALAGRGEDLWGPAAPACRLHGDLWWGNVLWAADDRVALIDPAAHGGPAEVDLAMLDLFGGLPERVTAAYDEVSPLPSGWRQRTELHQVTPLLVHAALFGGGYGARAAAVARRYA